MALAVFFRKTAEQDSTVTYEFGPDPNRTDRSLVLETVAGDVRLAVETDDPITMKVARKVLRLRDETGTWPETGDYFA